MSEARKCKAVKRDGTPCEAFALPGLDRCAAHAKKRRSSGLYARRYALALKEIYDEVEREGELEQLSRTDLEEELRAARIQLMDILGDEEATPRQRLTALEIVSRIVKTAKLIKELDRDAIRKEFMDAILTAVTHAFYMANRLATPSARSEAFIRELMAFFPTVDDSGRPTARPQLEGSVIRLLPEGEEEES